MATAHWVPTKTIWVCVHNTDYSERRKIPGNEGFADIEEAETDAQNFKKGAKKLGARLVHLKMMPDAGYDDLKDLFSELQKELLNAETSGQKTLVFFYYAGHGVQKNFTFAVCNEEKLYPLEKMLRILATTKNCYVLGVLDCCRSEFKQNHRGYSAPGGGDQDTEGSQNNLILTYGCPPSDTTPAKSTISVAYFDRLFQKANDATG